MISAEELLEADDLSIDDVTEYILNIPKFAEKIGIDDLRILMDKLGNPQDKAKAVHVAGTNGKGSTTEMIRLMLTEKGFRTGSFTSPHLVKINERIAVDGVMISDSDLVRCFRTVLSTVCSNSLRHPSFFEFVFAVAAVYFAEKKVDRVVYETGMGGRLDATNIIIPEVSVITSVGMDHMQYLGDTIEKIAYEKAGIIKPGVPVVHNEICDFDGELKKRAAEVIEKRAAELGCEFYPVTDRDVRKLAEKLAGRVDNPAFTVKYQRENAATAVRAFECIFAASDEIYDISARALNKFIMPARMEKIRNNVIIDGAHNTDAIPHFLSAAGEMSEMMKPDKVKLVFAVSSDKDYPEMVRMIYDAGLFDEIYLTSFHSVRKTDVGKIRALFEKAVSQGSAGKTPEVYAIPELGECLDRVLPGLGERELLFTAGSLYLAGEIEALLRK